MRQIIYAGETFLTSERIAKALIAYAEALASEGAARVTIPVVDAPTASIRWTEFVIGPASQLVSEQTAEDGVTIPDEDEIVRDLEERRLQMISPPGVVAEQADGHAIDDLDIPEESR